MKYFTKTLLAFCFTGLFGCFTFPTPSMGGPAIAEYKENVQIRETLSPSVFLFNMKIYVDIKDKDTGKDFFCGEEIGTAFVPPENSGYFLTNNHVVDLTQKKEICFKHLSKKYKAPVTSFSGLNLKTEMTLTDSKKQTFSVHTIKTFPEIDLAILAADNRSLVQDAKAVSWRTGSPKVSGDTVTSGKGPMIISDEPIAIMGMPKGLPFTITKGMLGAGVFKLQDGEVLIHFIAPTNAGNSGGPLISLLDFKVIGMVTMVKTDRGNITEHAGAIPFWVIQKALKQENK